ncbi:MAG: hypothetical protein ABFC63_00340 [Thermoguttaceae bacterium]
MRGNLDEYRRDLKQLATLGEEMLVDISLRDAAMEGPEKLAAEHICGCFERNYQRWYTEAGAVVAQLISGRSAEFEQLYLGDGRRKAIDADSYNIQDWLTGRKLPAPAVRGGESLAVSLRLKMQLEILKSAETRLESSLFEMRQLVQADLFDSEIEACRALASHGFLRAAGAMAGVILERHLRQLAESHEVVVSKKEPTLNDLNDRLKMAGVVDVPTWRHIQRLADIRNLCDHNKHRDPHKREVHELIDATDGIVKTLV